MIKLITPIALLVATIISYKVVINYKWINHCNSFRMIHNEISIDSSSSLYPQKAYLEKSCTLLLENTESVNILMTNVNSLSDDNSILAAPFAIPVLTQEEAIKANNDALSSFAAINKPKTKPLPKAIPVLTQEDAVLANQEAIKFNRNQANAKRIQTIIFKFQTFFSQLKFKNIILIIFPLLLILDVIIPKKRLSNLWFIKDLSLHRRMSILFSVSLLVYGVLVFVPWSVYFGNSAQFPFIFHDFVDQNLFVLSACIVGISIILLIIPPTISDYFVAILAGFGTSVYVQVMFMNQHLGTMNGIEPNWSMHRVFGTINIIIWIAIILIPFLLKKHVPSLFSNIISTSTGIVLSLELLATVTMVISAGSNVWSRKISFFHDGTEQFHLSKEKNVVVFFFDNLSSEFINLCFEKYPETKDIVKDFTWYIDARSNYTSTFPALISELTGSLIHIPAKSSQDLFEKSWHSSSSKSFYKQILDSGYDARLYGESKEIILGPPKYYHEFFSNVKVRETTCVIDYDQLFHCLFQMSGFSSAPFFFKKFFFYSFDFSDNVVKFQIQEGDSHSDSETNPNNNDTFFKKLSSCEIETDAKKPTFSFYYTHGTHGPWLIDEECNRLSNKLDNPVPTTRSCFFILSEFIRLLKNNNIYDNTAICIFSDHGAQEDLPGGLNPSGRANPYDMAFMIKPFHENKNELTLDYSKIQSIDILPTLLHLSVGDTADFGEMDGCPSFSIPNDRTRFVYRMVANDSYPKFDWAEDLLAQFFKDGNCCEEYIFVNSQSFRFGSQSKSYVRLIPLVQEKTNTIW